MKKNFSRALALMLCVLMSSFFMPNIAMADASPEISNTEEQSINVQSESKNEVSSERNIEDVPEREESIGNISIIIEDSVPTRTDLVDGSGESFDDPGPIKIIGKGTIKLYPSDSMMSVIARFCKEKNIEQVGAEKGYISRISNRAEFDRGPGSGWMGTLNDWCTNLGFANFTVENGDIQDGDKIHLMYTTDLGKDIECEFKATDKSLKNLKTNLGELSPAFNSNTHDYSLILPASSGAIVLTPEATNKIFQVKTFVGEKEYRRNSEIPIESDTTIVVKCGDPSWASLNEPGTPAETYTIHVINGQSLLDQNSVSAFTIPEEGGTEETLSLSYDKTNYTFKGTLPEYTQLKPYNAGGIKLKLPGLPEGASAELVSEDGSKKYPFIDRIATTQKDNPLINIGEYKYFIKVTENDCTEQYPLILKKGGGSLQRCNFHGTPEFSEIINGQVEGSLFQLDETGKLTGKIGFERFHHNYNIYVSEAIDKIGIKNAINDFSASGGANTNLKVNGRDYITTKLPIMPVSYQFVKKPIALVSDTTIIELNFGSKINKNVDVTYTFNVIKKKTTPQELESAINALPSLEDISYEKHIDIILGIKKRYDNYSEEKKAQISQKAVEKLLNAVTAIEKLYDEGLQTINELTILVKSYEGLVNEKNYQTYANDIKQSHKLYYALADWCQVKFKKTNQYKALNDSYTLVSKCEILSGDTIGKPTNYIDDFMVSANAYNLTLGSDEEAYPVFFREIWTKNLDQGLPYTLPERLTFSIKDPSIFEIKEKMSSYEDQGLGAPDDPYENMLYYLVPKKEGTTTFTVNIRSEAGEYLGQIPEIAVHVNSVDEAGIENLENKLTNIYSLPYTTKYDSWHYLQGTEGAEFTFKVNGTNPKVSVYSYLKYDDLGNFIKTEYPVDSNGNVTILLKDGYNPIEVTANYEGQEVTQLYGLKGKVISYEIVNITRPGNALKQGDIARLNILGLATPVSKILRIFNPCDTQFRYDTDLSRLYTLKSTTGQYKFGSMDITLTSPGKITLSHGRIYQQWFGSPLYAETTQGNTGGMAPQSKLLFSKLPNISFDVAENPDYQPSYLEPVVEGGNIVKAGQTVKISIPDLDLNKITDKHKQQSPTGLKAAQTEFTTNIPGVSSVKSEEYNVLTGVKNPLSVIKTLELKVPENTPSGTYKLVGGIVRVVHGEGWWLKDEDMFATEINDIEIIVKNPSSGGSSSNKNRSESATTTTTPDNAKVSVTKDSNSNKIASASVKGSETTKSGNTTVSVSRDQISNAVTEAVKAAKAEGTSVKPEVNIKITGNSTTKNIETSIPVTSLKEIAKNNTMQLKVTSPVGNIILNNEALLTIKDSASGNNLSVSIEKTTIENRPACELNIKADRTQITNFGKGQVIVSLPYSLQNGEQPEGLVVRYIAKDGTKTDMQTTFDNKKDLVSFVTNHFSSYVIDYDASLVKSDISFSDVKSTDWFKESVIELASKGILSGKTKTTFAPSDNITRAEFVAILARMSGQKMPEAGKNFEDVKDNSWYAQYVTWAVNAGIAKGTSETIFSPNSNISRQDMAVMITRYASYMNQTINGTNELINFTDDNSIANYAKESVKTMQQAGIINGVKAGDGSYRFAPKNNATRAEASIMIYQLIKLMDK